MPIPIIIAILLALFTLGTQMNQGGSSKQGGKQINLATKKAADVNKAATVTAAPVETNETEEPKETTSFDNNIFQFSGLYQIIKAEPMKAISNSY